MLKNLVGLVTGGASGLGKAAAETLVKEGCHITICDLPSSVGKEVAKNMGPEVNFSPTDVLSSEGVEEMFKNIKRRFGRLDFIVNCAGISCSHKIYNFNSDRIHSLVKLENVFNTNLKGTFNVIRHGAKYIAENAPDEDELRGTIINTAGVESMDGQIGQSVISAVSGGITSMTLPIARDLSERGIRVMCICVGLINTPLVAPLPERVKYHLADSCTAPKRFGKPEEFGHTVKFILENHYVNASVIRLDAGLRLYLR